MLSKRSAISRRTWRLMVYLVTLCLGSLPGLVSAHPMPNSVLLLDIQSDGVTGELQLPLSELQLAFGHSVNQHPETLIDRLGPELRAYIQKHIRPVSADGRAWHVAVGEMQVNSVEQPYTGIYHELTAQLKLQAPAGAPLRRFTLTYDLIIHQVVTHKALVSIRQDWETGQFGDQPAQVGVIQLDVVNNTIPPLIIEQATGSAWQGFRGMVALGMQHIADGTDHLLFLLVLLLPAPLLVTSGSGPQRRARRFRWNRFGGVRYSLKRLLLIVTAFTLGHSLTLLAGALGWLRLPSQPVEVLIAVSILVSAVHAVRPLFPGREAWVAAGFGLIHGLAFAGTLTNLHLDAGPMALSILGFNLGIELMQVGIIALVIPWLILLSQTPYYGGFRWAGAVFAGVAATAWILERVSGEPNAVTAAVAQVAQQAEWLLAGLVLFALVGWWRMRHTGPRSTKQLPLS